jgi:hypothetical protein
VAPSLLAPARVALALLIPAPKMTFPHYHRQEERFINTEEERECLRKRWKDLQYKGDIQDYIVRMEALNYQVYLSRIAWREALHSGFDEDIKDRLSFSKLAPNDDSEHELLLQQVGHAYERRLQEKNKHHHNDHKPKDKKNKRKRDDDGDKGSDSKNPRTEKRGPEPVHTNKGVALKRHFGFVVGN